MGLRERRAREKEDLRQEILDAARDLFIREGYEAVSMRKIADRIEYSPTTIYLYFRDKSELFDCLSEQAFGKLLEKLQSIGDRGSGTRWIGFVRDYSLMRSSDSKIRIITKSPS